MNIETLMLGDFVKYKNLNEQDMICKVCSVSNTDGGIVYCQFKDGIFDVHQSTIHPIPLSEEIIKKNTLNSNGIFCNKAEGFEDAQERDTYEIHISGYCIGINGFIWYVHELQQALRLAGLKEMADNFKI